MVETIRHSQSYTPPASMQIAAWWRFAWPYGVAILGVTAGLAVNFAFASALHGEASYVLFLPAVLIASALGGWGPGLLATALGLALGLFSVAESRQFATADAVTGFVFALVAIAVSWRGAILLRFRRIATASTQDAEAHTAHLQSILGSIPDAMVVINERGLIQSFSAAAERLFGYAAAGVLGKNVKILMPSPYRASGGSSASDASSSAGVATARLFRWNSQSAKCMCATSVSSPVSSETLPSANRPKRGCRNCSLNSFICRV